MNETKNSTQQSTTGARRDPVSLRAFFQSIWSLAFVSVSGFLFYVVLARLLPVEDIGHIRLIRPILDFASLPASFGMGICIAKFVAERGKSDEARFGILRTGMLLCLITSVLSAVALTGVMFIPGILNDEIAVAYLRVLGIAIPGIALFRCVIGFYQGTGKISRLAWNQAGRAGLWFVLGVGLSWKIGLFGWAIGLVIIETVAVAFGWKTALLPAIRFRSTGETSTVAKSMARFGGFTMLTHILNASVTSIDLIALDQFIGDPKLIAQYGIGTLMFTTALLLPHAFVQSHFFRMSAHGAEARQRWKQFLSYLGIVVGLFVVPAALIGWIAHPVVGMIFGEDYTRAGEIFVLLLPAFVIQSAGAISAGFVVGAGWVRAHLASMIVACAIGLPIMIYAVSQHGVNGAVLGITITFTIRTITLIGILWLRRR